MTDNDKKLIHDLKICSEANHFMIRGERYKGQVLSALFREALDLINRQEEKLEAVKSLNYLQLEELESSKAEIEKLEQNLANVTATMAKCECCIIARAEAITEFAERLCEDRVSNDPVVIAVKTELKMMKGEQ